MDPLPDAHLVELSVIFGFSTGNVFRATLVSKGRLRRRLVRHREQRFITWGPFDFARRRVFVTVQAVRRLIPRNWQLVTRRILLAILLIFVLYALINDPRGFIANTGTFFDTLISS
jgi:hypothetical protein